jgi:hypothetical protein
VENLMKLRAEFNSALGSFHLGVSAQIGNSRELFHVEHFPF